MKQKICLAMSGLLAMGTVQAYGRDWAVRTETHVYTAEVGTTRFLKDGEAQPLDVEIYLKEGYVMLPLRTFLTAVDAKASIYWEEPDTVLVRMGESSIAMDTKENTIRAGRTELEVSGEIEVKEGRVFVPLRNWSTILRACGYQIGEGDIQWDAKTKTATIHIGEEKLDVEEIKEKSIITGEGKAAVFALPWTEKYDEIENIGGGYFLAEKYQEENVGLGEEISSRDNSFYLLDSTGKELLYFVSDAIRDLRSLGEGYFLVRNRDFKKEDMVIDRSGKTIFTTSYSIFAFSEGLAMVWNKDRYGFVDMSGKLVIPMEYCEAKPFSEGLAAISLEDSQVYLHGQYNREKWGYIDKTGKLVIDAKYQTAEPFSEGLAMVRTEDGVGYIDKTGKEVIPCQYRWGGYFCNGMTYVTEEDSQETWLIDQTGKKLKLIATGKYVTYRDDSFRKDGKPKNGVLQKEEIVEYGDTHSHVISLYDETGEISFETYELKKGLSEGLSPLWDNETRKYGYADENGVQVIAPAFDEAEPFKDGYAVVANEITKPDGKIDVEWGIIQHP